MISNVFLTNTGFLISPRLKEILSNSVLITHRYYPAKVYHKKKCYDYFWLETKTQLFQSVNFKESTFNVELNYAHNVGDIDINSFEDYLLKKENLKQQNPGKSVSIWAHKIALPASAIEGLDLFKIGSFDTSFYISKSLKEQLLHNHITGIDISPADNLLI